MSHSHTPVTEQIGDYLEQHFSSEDEFLQRMNEASVQQGVPPISVGGAQGRFMQFLLKASGAKNILEIGSLVGYSSITMARALPDDGHIYCCELNERFAEYLRANAEAAGVGHKITVLVGPALETLATTTFPALFDFVFIDADKPNYVNYLHAVLPLVRSGGIIAGDNCLAWGEIASSDPEFERPNVVALQAFNAVVAQHPDLFACFVPIGDGMAMGIKR